MSKSLHDWSPEDVSLWVSELGPWSKDYGTKFVLAGSFFVLILTMTDFVPN